MASFKAKFPVLQEVFAKKHRGGFSDFNMFNMSDFQYVQNVE